MESSREVIRTRHQMKVPGLGVLIAPDAIGRLFTLHDYTRCPRFDKNDMPQVLYPILRPNVYNSPRMYRIRKVGRRKRSLYYNSKMKISVDELIAKINDALVENGETPLAVDSDKLKAIPANQLPPYVAEIEEKLFSDMLTEYENRQGKAEPSIVECIRFIAKAESIRIHTYRKLAFAKLDEYLENSGLNLK